MILAVDFDGVVHDPYNRAGVNKMGEPVPGAKETLDWLHEHGARIIIHTIWADKLSGRIAIATWLDYHHIQYHEITALKPKDAHHFIDDRNLPVPFTNWQEIKAKMEEIYGEDLGRSNRQNTQSIRPSAW